MLIKYWPMKIWVFVQINEFTHADISYIDSSNLWKGGHALGFGSYLNVCYVII